MLRITDQIAIEDWEIVEQFVRASGPGGQNVNKVNSAVELRFEAARSPNLPEPVKRRLRRVAGRRWTTDGAVVLQVADERSQSRNRDLARDRLRGLIAAAARPPKKRVATKVPRSQKRKRLAEKRHRGEIKARRGDVDS